MNSCLATRHNDRQYRQRHAAVCTLLVVAVVTASSLFFVSAFQPLAISSSAQTIRSKEMSHLAGRMTNFFPIQSSSSTTSQLWMVLYDPLTNEEHAEALWVDFPTALQRTELKKEASKRRARNTLATYKLPPQMLVGVSELVQALNDAKQQEDEDNARFNDMEEMEGDNDAEEEEAEVDEDDDEDDMIMLYDDNTLDEIWQKLREHEAVQLKGVCAESKKYVYAVGSWICVMLEERQEAQLEELKNSDRSYSSPSSTTLAPLPVVLPVALLETKGHTCLIYSPTLPVDHENKFIKLRTSVGMKNTWMPREKAPRDYRGQIIKGWKEMQRQDGFSNE